MLALNDTVFVLVDVQGKLAQLMDGKETLFRKLRQLVLGIQALHIPIVWMEQNAAKMGPTIPELRDLLGNGDPPIDKMSFSCCGHSEFLRKLQASGRRTVLMAGIEAHVCICQTAADLLPMGYRVEIVADAVSSRTAEDRIAGLERAKALGAGLMTVEMVLFALLKTAEHPAFRDILRIVR